MTQKDVKQRKKMPLVVGVLALLVIGGGGWFWWHKNHQGSMMKPVAPVPYVMALPPLMSTLDNGSGRPSYVRVTAQLELSDQKDAPVVKDHLAEIQDLFQTYFHDTHPDELSGVGIYRLREAMLAQIGNILAPVSVRNLFFTELLVQ